MDNPFEQSNSKDKFENGVLTTTGCFSRHSASRNEQELSWLARQNELKLDKFKDTDQIVCTLIEKLSNLNRSIDESIWDYFERVKTEMM